MGKELQLCTWRRGSAMLRQCGGCCRQGAALRPKQTAEHFLSTMQLPVDISPASNCSRPSSQ
ncbi:hypothetical protein AOLI_G00299030, partial [Acnodon oligacanthus]